MARTVGIGIQSFDKLIRNQYLYIDKTDFIREWWEQEDIVTLITRPRRFGKTLNLSMMECFFSVNYAGRGKLFEGPVIKPFQFRKLNNLVIRLIHELARITQHSASQISVFLDSQISIKTTAEL